MAIPKAIALLGIGRSNLRLIPTDERFRIVTPEGTFEMTKAEFYRDFDNVVRSMSYRDRGLYHYPTTPEKALKYLV